jgi:PilZ domain
MRPGRNRCGSAQAAGGIALNINYTLWSQLKFFLGGSADNAPWSGGRNLPQENISKQHAPSGIEQRKAPRKKVLLTGKVIHGDGAYVLDCTIRDVSATGARITLAQGRAIPEAVYLLDMVNRVAYEAVVVSERAGGLGLKFKKTLRLAEITAPELRYLKRIWLEYAR